MLFSLTIFLWAASYMTAAENPAIMLKRSCTPCHRLDVVKAQRLSREEWEEELAKMTSMGAKIKDRAALLDYLVRRYGPEKSKQ